MRRRVLLYSLILLIIPALMAGWLLREQLPIWMAPRYEWFSASDGTPAPAACESADALRTFAGTRADGVQQPVSADAAQAAALEAIRAVYGSDPGVVSVPIAFHVRIDSAARMVWWVSAASFGGNPAAAAIILVDAQTGSVIEVMTVTSPAEVDSCAFDMRRAIIEMARSTPSVLLAIYVTGLIVLGMGVILWRAVRRRAA